MSKLIGDVSAYAYAVSKGYAGTEEEFAELMADYADVGQRAEDAADRAEAALDEFTSVTADATTLPEGSSATAEYSDGNLTLGIPKGDKGDTGAKGDGAVYAVIGNMASVIPVGTDGYLTSAYTITIPVTFYSGKDNVTGSVTSSDLYISRSSGGSGEMDTVPGSTYRNVKTATIIYAIPAGWRVGNGRITLTVTIGTTTLTYYHAYTTAPTGQKGDKGDKGDTGNTGNTPNLTIGTVTTLQPTAPATATISGTADNPVLSFGIPKGDTGEVSQAQFDAALALKADAIGNYPELAVGTAEQIDSDTVVSEDVAPYQFRQSISGASNRAYDKIVGGSLAVNQLMPIASSSASRSGNGVVITDNRDGSYTIQTDENGATADDNLAIQQINNYIVRGHKYYLGGFSENTQTSTTWWFADLWSGAFGYPNGRKETIAMAALGTAGAGASTRLDLRVQFKSGAVISETVKPVIIDLTAMFGTTIADYVYGLETATAGAGVDWLKAHFPRIFNAGYVPYNAGELVSVQASAHKMTGFNQWDEEWELGTINASSGLAGADNTRIRAKNYNQCLPNTVYYLKDPTSNNNIGMRFYDADKNYLGYGASQWIGDTTFTTPANCAYFKFVMAASYGTTYNNDICINISSSRNGEYEPYSGHTYPLDSDLELRGLPKLDADNNLVYDGDVYESTGKVARRYGIVDLGAIAWVKVNQEYNPPRFYSSALSTLIKSPSGQTQLANVVCSKYKLITQNAPWSEDKVISITTAGVIYIMDSAYSTADALKTALDGVKLVYEKATPTTESAQPFTNPQVVDASGTEEYVTDSVVPVGHVTKYVENLKAKLESAPASPAEDGDYIVRQTDGVNEYVPLDSAPAITAKADVSELLKAFPVDTASGAIASFTDGAELPLKSLAVDIEPVQDLHGQANPYPAGGQIWDEEWELGSINSVDGQNTAMSDRIRSKNYVSVQSNTEYYVFMPDSVFNGNQLFIALYRDDKTYIRSSLINAANGFTSRKLPATFIGDAAFIRLWFASDYGTTYNHNISINYPATDTEYHPYSNICPISGWSEVNVSQSGKFNAGAEYGSGDGFVQSAILKADNTTAENPAYFVTAYFPITPDSDCLVDAVGIYNAPAICFYDASKTFISGVSYANRRRFTVHTPSNCAYARMTIYITNAYASGAYDNCTSISIQLGQTVYGGTLDVVSGELTVDRAMVDLNDASLLYDDSGKISYRQDFSDRKIYSDSFTGLKCSCFPAVESATQYIRWRGASQYRISFVGSSIADLTALIGSNNLQICYELATPTTVTLTPNELSTLLGANNIWSDAGEVTAEYRADPTLFIQRKIAEALS